LRQTSHACISFLKQIELASRHSDPDNAGNALDREKNPQLEESTPGSSPNASGFFSFMGFPACGWQVRHAPHYPTPCTQNDDSYFMLFFKPRVIRRTAVNSFRHSDPDSVGDALDRGNLPVRRRACRRQE
jgi:hypothetical protein